MPTKGVVASTLAYDTPQTPIKTTEFTFMPDSYGEGGQFAADLGELYETATKSLRPLAGDYSRFSSVFDESNAYDLDPQPAVGAVSRGQSALRSGAALTALRDDLQYVFAKSCENVESAAATLIEVANNYAAADEETQSDFDSYLADNDLAGPTLAPPRSPVYPDGRNQPRPRD